MMGSLSLFTHPHSSIDLFSDSLEPPPSRSSSIWTTRHRYSKLRRLKDTLQLCFERRDLPDPSTFPEKEGLLVSIVLESVPTGWCVCAVGLDHSRWTHESLVTPAQQGTRKTSLVHASRASVSVHAGQETLWDGCVHDRKMLRVSGQPRLSTPGTCIHEHSACVQARAICHVT